MEHLEVEQGGGGGGGGGGAGRQQRLQNAVDDGREAINENMMAARMFFIGLLFIVAISFVFWKRGSHHHPGGVAALWCQPNATVAFGGHNGAFSTISEAVEAAPCYSGSRYCIHIKGGRYIENVVVGEEKPNIVFVGDGVEKTIIAANRTCGTQHCELQVATLWVRGAGFIAVDLAIENNEDPVNLETAAVENWSDGSVFYRCSLRSAHEVVRAYEYRQFYRDCHIEGTGSLIYGRALAYFQRCTVAIDGQMKNVVYTVAEQLRQSADEIGGFVFHKCKISADGDLTTSRLVLGAAGKPYAIVVYLQCLINLQEAGWTNNGFTGGTVFFAEYGNTGVGAAAPNTSSSADLHFLDSSSASGFSLRNFFGWDWLPADVPRELDLAS